MTLVVTGDGRVHVPFSLYLNMRLSNRHTKDGVARSLRILGRLSDAFDVDIAQRALVGECLKETELAALRQLAFCEWQVIEAMSDHDVRNLAVAQAGRTSRRRATVASNTAVKHLVAIAGFMDWYYKTVISPRMPLGSEVSTVLAQRYAYCVENIKRGVAGTKSLHPHRIRSMPARAFLRLYSEVFTNAEEVFKSPVRGTSSTTSRDRAMFLLACEGLRPGALGGLALADFKWRGGDAQGYITITNHGDKRAVHKRDTPRQKGLGSAQSYNSEITVSIWPTTAQAIQNYIDGERQAVVSKTLRNRSAGFLFLSKAGTPIGDRGTIQAVMERARDGLRQLGLLARDPEDPYLRGEEYEFSAYLLRHSAASLFYELKSAEQGAQVAQSLMKDRFGWTMDSQMPNLYARRAMTDAASLRVEQLIDEMLREARSLNGTDRAAKARPKSQLDRGRDV